MRLALQEMRRRPGRFATAAVLLTLIAMLLMLLGGLLDGLIQRSTGAIRAQRADLVVFSATAEKSFLRSRITPEMRAQVEAVPGVSNVGGVGVTQLGARVPGNGPRDLIDVALFGYEVPPRGVPLPPEVGEAYADSILQEDGVRRGETLTVGPARTPVRIVGFVDDVSYSGAGTLWASPATWRDVQNANRPALSVGPGVFQALVVRTERNASSVARAIDRATGGATETVSSTEAADSIGGVRQQRSVFNQIIAVTLVVATVVVALFFALLTVERIGLYGMLKAIGARSRTLFGGVVVQAMVVALVAAVVGSGFALLFDRALPPGTIPYQLLPSRLIVSSVALAVRGGRGQRVLAPTRPARRPCFRDREVVMNNGTAPALRMESVRKVYPTGEEEVIALDHATLTIAHDEIVALVGPSGSGKTTLCSIAGGILSPTEGSVIVAGKDISEYSSRRLTDFRREHVGFVFQTVNLVPFLTARENLLIVDEIGRRTGAPARKRADQLLEELDLTNRRDHLPATLSGGQRQRVAIGRALMNDPDLVLFDEPTSSLDTHLGEQVMGLIRSEMNSRGIAAIVVTHDERMTHYADRTVHITDGVLVE